MNCCIWPIDGILTGTTTLGQSESRGNGNEKIIPIPQRTGAWQSGGLVSYPGHWWGEDLTLLQRCSVFYSPS